jgi:hypothetical protein
MTDAELHFILSHPLQGPQGLPEALVSASIAFSNRAMECDIWGSRRAADGYEDWAARLCCYSVMLDQCEISPAAMNELLRIWKAAPMELGYTHTNAEFVKEVLSTLI